MSGCPVRQVRHVYKNRTGGPITSYSTIGKVCKLCISSFPTPPPPPPPPPHNILVGIGTTNTAVIQLYVEGSGTYIVDSRDPVPFNEPAGFFVPVTVYNNSKIYILSANISTFVMMGYPILSTLSISNAPTLHFVTISNSQLSGVFDVSSNINLEQIELSDNLLTGVTGLNVCPNLSSINITNTNITQSAADSIANQINVAGATDGYLNISSQKTGTINTTGAIYNTLRGKNWTII